VSTEAKLEARCAKYVELNGGIALKIEAQKGYPDRLFITANGYMLFCEFKAPKGTVAPIQKHVLRELAKRHVAVHLIYDYEYFTRAYDLPIHTKYVPIAVEAQTVSSKGRKVAGK
jgi:hypothetical protein